MRLGTKIQVFGFYTLNYANGDAAGVSGFPSNSYNIARTMAAHHSTHATVFFLAARSLCHIRFASVRSWWRVRVSPFNVTSPNDLNGDSVFNDRPGFISTSDMRHHDHQPDRPKHLLHAPGNL